MALTSQAVLWASVVASSAAASALLSLLLYRYLPRVGRTVPDVMKGNRPVAHPGGPAWFAGFAVGMALMWGATGDPRALAVLLTALVAFAVGLVDDLKILPGPAKVAGTVAAAAPILLLGAYEPRLQLPFIGFTRLTIIYPLLVLVGVPVAANAVNMVDVVNGVVSASGVMVSLTIAGFELMSGNSAGALAALALAAASAGFWALHRYPSRILPGDSGSLMLGAALAALAISYKAEVVTTVALLPEALNGFFVLSTVKSLAEHRKMKARPTVVVDGKLAANDDPSAPLTLTRLLASRRPLSEREVGRGLLALQAYGCALALITGLMMVI